ncbi:MAG: prepilin-type N-terminal cleavage/methylation domain-containing protein [Solirubrobacteraceae bacterium]
MKTAARLRDERGNTLVEVMAAMVILIIGVLGTLTMVQGGLASTDRTSSREQATNLVRDLVERSRQAAYADITYDNAAAKLRSMLPASDNVSALSGSTFSVTRRKTTYGVTVIACSIDDPTDGVGVGDAKSCAPPDGTRVPGSATPGLAASVNVLGITVTAGGSLLETVCNAIGISSIANQLTAASVLTNKLVPVSVCPTASGSATAPYDNTPDDLRRVRVTVSWTRGTNGSVSQTTLLTNPLQTTT